MELTHINDQGRGRMVDVSDKPDTKRYALAKGKIRLKKETAEMILGHGIKKGDVLSIAQVGGILGAKKNVGNHSHVPQYHDQRDRYRI